MLNFPFRTPKKITLISGQGCHVPTEGQQTPACSSPGVGRRGCKGEEKTALSEAEALRVSASLEGADFSES